MSAVRERRGNARLTARDDYPALAMTDPAHADADLRRAKALHAAGRLAEAGGAYQSILRRAPRHPDALLHLGEIAGTMRLDDQAVALIRASLELRPDSAEAWNSLGVVLATRGDDRQAVDAFARARSLAPDRALILANLGRAYARAGEAEKAAALHRDCIALEPANPAHHVDLGNALLARKDAPAALDGFARALALDPDSVDAGIGYGLALAAQNRMYDAADRFRELARSHPQLAEAHYNLAVALFRAGRLGEAIAPFRAAVACDPSNAVTHANLVFALDLDPAIGPEEALAERRRFGARHCLPPSAIEPHGNDRTDPARRLRVGYVSGDFLAHSAADVIAPIILNHTAAVDVVCYSEVREPDAVTEAFRSAVPHWRESWRMDDGALASQIRADEIDVLVDLSGYSKGNRLTAFGRKPAPIQVQAWGHPLGSGLATMDYLLSDPVMIPDEERRFFVETVHHLSSCFHYQPVENAPVVTPPPSDSVGTITFGTFNRVVKINDDVVRCWAEILDRVPGARLLAKDIAFDDAAARDRFAAMFAARGIEPDRVIFRGRTSKHAHLAAYAEVDVALDPFPQTGGVTTFEALWMGVPVVTLYGTRPQGRVSASLLSILGLRDHIARCSSDYVAAAIRAANDRCRLRALRMRLRDQILRSILCDHAAFVAEVEQAYRVFWQRWLNHADPRSTRTARWRVSSTLS